MALLKAFFVLILSTLVFTFDNATTSLSSSSTDMLQPLPLINRRIMTGMKFVAAPIAISLHLSIIYIFFFSKRRQKYKNVFYRLVLVISMTDIYWCNYYIYQGLCHVLGYCLGGETVNIIFSTGAIYMFFLCMNMDLLIAFNRFSAVVLYDKHESVFNPQMGTFFIFLFALASAVECIPSFMYKNIWLPEYVTFSYYHQPPEELTRLIKWIDLTCTYIAHIVLVILYLWSFISYRKRVTKSATIDKEIRLLYQGFFSAIPCFMMMTFHHLVPSALLELLGGFWCVTNGPFAYLWFNSELRADFFDIYFGLKKTTERIYNKVSLIPGLNRRANAVHAAQNENGIKRTADVGSDLTKPGMQASSQNAINMTNTIQNLQTDNMDKVREHIDCD